MILRRRETGYPVTSTMLYSYQPAPASRGLGSYEFKRFVEIPASRRYNHARYSSLPQCHIARFVVALQVKCREIPWQSLRKETFKFIRSRKRSEIIPALIEIRARDSKRPLRCYFHWKRMQTRSP